LKPPFSMTEPRKAWIFLAASILSPSGMGEVVTETVGSCQLAVASWQIKPAHSQATRQT
jgi:hypothetical protein